MPSEPSNNQFAEFDAESVALLDAAGLKPPADLLAGVLSEARTLRQSASLLRAPRGAAAEPANIFSLTRYIAGRAK